MSSASSRSSKSPVVVNTDVVSLLQQSATERKLMVVIGTGMSLSLAPGVPTLSWKGLVQSGFDYAVRKGRIPRSQRDAWRPQIESDDMDELLTAAEFMGRKLEAPTGDLYARWMEESFAGVKPTNAEAIQAAKAIQAAEIPIITLNYDHLLEDVTDLPPITLEDPRRVTAFMRREEPGILHLHGSFRAPSTCVLGIKEYAAAIASETRDLVQRTLSAFSRLLFIGCGGTFADPNFSRLIRWLRSNLGVGAPEHHALVIGNDVGRYEADSGWQGFVQPVSYGASYNDLPGYITRAFGAIGKIPQMARSLPSSVRTEHTEILAAYRSFLIKDCGEMTIEGVRADMDTAQRRFDLEKLFVPSSLVAFPPEIPERDPHREQKLSEWQKIHGDPRPFGAVFEQQPRLALLALPGGGKTMLLKRLAVAYADPTRRARSTDELPDLPLTPVLIRCREWREHVHRPILSLLEHIHVITGRPELEGLRNALIPLFRNGSTILLVDGLDEIHDDGARTTFVSHLDAFVRDFPNVRIVVTSREAGFGLVAPRIASFCQRYRIPPLHEDAIRALCTHWHVLMSGDSATSRSEAADIATKILANAALRRLSENPLLLTMLLVVKHGAGRIPPDRVSLYGRAVDVLLDTWNTQGHEPLNVKEAVPQLAYIAYEMMRAGKQTATEKELLVYLEEARKIPRISLFARDRPHEFLKRVELRSSLLVEAGHQVDLGQVVPFFQFRHLTFQEYLAAVAVTEGHYSSYKTGDTVLSALKPYLVAAEWKEVVPMVAVLAKKAAEPLAAALVKDGQSLVAKVKSGGVFKEKKAWLDLRSPRLPAVVERLAQCLIEEAEFAPETLLLAMDIVAFFSRACMDSIDWISICRGPYGGLLLDCALKLYMRMDWPEQILLMPTCVRLSGWRHRWIHPDVFDSARHLEELLRNSSSVNLAKGLFTCTGILGSGWEQIPVKLPPDRLLVIQVLIEDCLMSEELSISAPAVAAWTVLELRYGNGRVVAHALMDRLVTIWLGPWPEFARIWAAEFLMHLSQKRGDWRPKLTRSQIMRIINGKNIVGPGQGLARLIVAYHRRDIWTDDEIRRRLREYPFEHKNAKLLMQLLNDASVEQPSSSARWVKSSSSGATRAVKATQADNTRRELRGSMKQSRSGRAALAKRKRVSAK